MWGISERDASYVELLQFSFPSTAISNSSYLHFISSSHMLVPTRPYSILHRIIHMHMPFLAQRRPHSILHHLMAKEFSLLSVQDSGIHTLLLPETDSSSLSLFRSRFKTYSPLQNCFPSLGSFPSPWTVYPDFDSCYSHLMPYRMTPSVRHRAIYRSSLLLLSLLLYQC